MVIASPFPRLGAQALAEAERAAGFAQACPYETSEQVHQEAVQRWREKHKPRGFGPFPSPLSVLLALVFVVM